MVQGGRLDPLLKAHATGTGSGPVDKLMVAYIAFTTATHPGVVAPSSRKRAGLLAWHVAGIALLLFEIKRPNPTSWVFRNWYPLPYVAACYKEMALLIPPVRHTSADQWLADLDFRFWDVNPTVWLERMQTPGLHRISADRLYPLRTGSTASRVAALVPAAISRVPILCVFNRLRLSGFLRRVLAGSGAGSAISLKTFAAHTVTRTVAVSRHAGHARPAGIGALRLFPERPHGTHHPGVVVAAEWSQIGCFGSISAYTLSIIFATVYLRYHYTVDVLAGASVGAAADSGSPPSMYRRLPGRERERLARN